MRSAQGLMEAQKRAATITAFLSTSVVVLESDVATNSAMAGLHVAFNAYMQSVIEISNNGGTPFMLTYKVGQEKITFLVIATGVIFVIIYYYIKLVIKTYRKGYEIAQSHNFSNKVILIY